MWRRWRNGNINRRQPLLLCQCLYLSTNAAIAGRNNTSISWQHLIMPMYDQPMRFASYAIF